MLDETSILAECVDDVTGVSEAMIQDVIVHYLTYYLISEFKETRERFFQGLCRAEDTSPVSATSLPTGPK